MRSNPDLVQENPAQSDAFGQWRKIGVEQGDDLHHDGKHGLSLVVVVVAHHALLKQCCWLSCCGVNVRLLAKLEVSWRPFVSLRDQWAVACFNKFVFTEANFKKTFFASAPEWAASTPYCGECRSRH